MKIEIKSFTEEMIFEAGSLAKFDQIPVSSNYLSAGADLLQTDKQGNDNENKNA